MVTSSCTIFQLIHYLMASDIKKSVLIIGAGPAGLTLAYELLSRSDQFDVTVLEKQEIV